MNFISQICTTIEQSERLIALGLKKETADMVYSNASRPFEENKFHLECREYSQIEKQENYQICPFTFIPAWSLHRLIEMCNETQFGMTIGIYNDEVTVDGELFEVFDNTYDNLISIIEWLIGLEKFNENYLDIH